MKEKITLTVDTEVVHFLALYSKAVDGGRGNRSQLVEKMLRAEMDRLTERGRIIATTVTLTEAYPDLKAEDLTMDMVSSIQERMNEKYKPIDFMLIGIKEFEDGRF